MKKLLLTIVTFSVLFVIGCQENSITDPVAVDPQNKVPVTDQLIQGTIILERMITDPYPVLNSYYIINGAVEYDFTIVSNKIPPVQEYSVSLNLNIAAGLTYVCTVCGEENDDDALVGNISSQSTDIITLIDDDSYILEKTYLIQGRDDGMVLHCKFIATTGGVTLEEIYLVLPENNTEDDSETS